MVVSDTSSISNLLQIGLIEILHELYGEVAITPSVKRELYRLKTHELALGDLGWISVVISKDQILVDELMLELDAGESESIALALEDRANYLIIDEFKGRAVADRLGIPIVGILGVLVQAEKRGLVVDLEEEIKKLRSVGFRLNQNLVDSVLARLKE